MVFPDSFFSKEERDGFVVCEMMKRAWAAELEVLEVVKDLCKKNSITYYASDGTLLGAIRHQGFIPWDDDIDICMLREDYDRFLEIAPQELPEGFVLAGIYGTEPRLWAANNMPQTRVIADETCFTLPAYMNRFHGFPYFRIGIDIFPYTYLPRDVKEQYRLIRIFYELNFTEANLHLYIQDGILDKRLQELERFTGVKFHSEDETVLRHELRLAADRYIAESPREESDAVVDAVFLSIPEKEDEFTGFEGHCIEWFGEPAELPFENTVVSVPKQYLKVAERTFGADFMTPKRIPAEHEYPFYKRQEAAFIQMLREAGVETPVEDFCRNWQKAMGV